MFFKGQKISLFKSLGLCIALQILFSPHTQAQDSLHVLQPADHFHAGRFYSGLGVSTVAYGATLYGLSTAWYKDSNFSKFHFHNDWGGWQNVDKAGHVFTNYFETAWVSKSLEWSGIPHDQAILYGAGSSLLFQSSIELLDAHSDRWGFSWSDMAANFLGSGIYLIQEYAWQEQRIQLKWSSQPVSYPSFVIPSTNDLNASSSPSDRAGHLFGRSVAERMLKDYNGQTIWASINVAEFLPPDTKWPPWLSCSLGYGAQNMYGAYSNSWQEGASRYQLTGIDPYQQFYIGPDINWSKIPTDSRWLSTIFEMLNVLRLPFPALEVNTGGKVIWHWVLL